jgi:apolipoprotein N-acyltransferase
MAASLSKLVLVSAPFVSGLLIVLSLPSFDLGFIAWFGLSPLFFALRQRGPLAASALGFLFGCSFGGGSFYWLNTIPFVTPFRFVLMIATGSVFYLLFGLVYNLLRRTLGAWAIVGGPAVWVVLEYARANSSFLSLPWNFLGHSQYQYLPLIQIVDVTGVYGISFLIAMTNQLLSELPDLLTERGLVHVRPFRTARTTWGIHLVLVVALLVGTLLYGWHRLAAPEEGEHLRVALVQGNLVPRSTMSARQQMETLRTYERLTKQAAREKPDIIVWPSSSLPAPFELWTVRLYVSRIASQAGAYLLVGGAGGDKLAPAKNGYLPYSNSELLISPSGRLEGQYNKMRLTPFLESVPLYGTITWPRFITSLERGYVPGDTPTLFELSGVRFGTPICWESAFPDLFRRFVLAGAHFMVSVTNEAGFGATSAPHQALAMVVFRAVENRVTIARAATTGVSAFIDSKGEISARIIDGHGRDLFVSGVSVRDVRLASKKTFYTLYGDVFAQALVGTVSLTVLMSVVMRRRRSGQPSGDVQPTPSMSGAG